MNSSIEAGLAFILFLPLFSILGALYWIFPRQPRNAARRLADALVLIVAGALSLDAVHWGFAHATRAGGRIWPQILATLIGYGVFAALVCIAVALRARVLRGRTRTTP